MGGAVFGRTVLGIHEQGHEAVTSGFIDVAIGFANAIKEGGEVSLHQIVQLGRRQLLTQSTVVADIQHQHRYVALDLRRQFRRVGIGCGQPFHRFGNEFGEVITQARDLVHLLLDGGLHLQSRLNAGEQLAVVDRFGQ